MAMDIPLLITIMSMLISRFIPLVKMASKARLKPMVDYKKKV
jgi:hypothetical protein